MTRQRDRSSSALCVVGVQTKVVAGSHCCDELVANFNALADKARAARTPVIWVQHHDDNLLQNSAAGSSCRNCSATRPKRWCVRNGDAFEDTILESELASRGIGRLIVAGAQTDARIRSTIHGAFMRGYDTVLASEARTTECSATNWMRQCDAQEQP